MQLEDVRKKVLAAIQNINIASIAGTEPQFDAQIVETRGDPVIGLIEKKTNDRFVVQIQKVKKR